MIRQIRSFTFLFLIMFLFGNTGYCFQKDTTVFLRVDSAPQFKYKDSKSTKECVDVFISENIVWPNDADIYAKILVQCIVELDGSLSNFKVIRSVEKTFDKASIDVVKLMPKWTPGIKDSKKVRTQIIIPVVWKLI